MVKKHARPTTRLRRAPPVAGTTQQDDKMEVGTMNNETKWNHMRLIKLLGVVGDRPALILVDSGSSGNFVSSAFAKQQPITLDKEERQAVRMADGTVQWTDGKTEQLGVCIGAYEDEIQFNILPLHRYDAILGAPWLQEYNPVIDWKKGEVRL